MPMSAKYDTLGLNYNRTRKADPYLIERLLSLLEPSKDASYLDIGCGTGNYTAQFLQKGFRFIGMDPSQIMLDKAHAFHPEGTWMLGAAEDTGLPNASVEGIVGTLTLHHWNNLEAAFKELYRILKPNGKLVFFTSTPQQMEGYWLQHYFPKMLEASIQQMPSLETLENALTRAGFTITATEPYEVRKDLQDHFLYCGKEQPELYLDPIIRQGISSFSNLALQEEVHSGLTQLKSDIASHKIQNVIESYENHLGDYLFIVAQKTTVHAS